MELAVMFATGIGLAIYGIVQMHKNAGKAKTYTFGNREAREQQKEVLEKKPQEEEAPEEEIPREEAADKDVLGEEAAGEEAEPAATPETRAATPEAAGSCAPKKREQEEGGMIITTAPSIEGHPIAEHVGIVCGVELLMDIAGNKKMRMDAWKTIVREAMRSMEKEARAIGADAVIAVQQSSFSGCLCLMGTAVRLMK